MLILLIKLKRVYEPPAAEDGYRILIDRLWPRGMSKEKANLSLWLKDIAPREELRQWFSHNPERWIEFKEKYCAELSEKKDLIKQIKELEKEHQILTLIYSSRDLMHNNAIVLKNELERS